jgi:hypothetical protein
MSKIQSILFNKGGYDFEEVIEFLKERDLLKHTIKIDNTKNYYRARQIKPTKNKFITYRIIETNDPYIKLVIQFFKQK